MDLETLRRTAAFIAAAAVTEIFPDAELLGGGETDLGFEYTFFCKYPIHFNLIEERMRSIVKEKRAIRTLEMVAFSASELLKKEGRNARVEELEGVEGLVELIQIGDFVDLGEGPYLKNTAELAAFKIELDSLPEKVYRIRGFADGSKEALKEFLRQLESYVDPRAMGEKMGLWKGDVWLSQGLGFRDKLIDLLQKNLFIGAEQVEAPAGAKRPEIFRSLGVKAVWEKGSQGLMGVFFSGERSSCLQSIAKTLIILGFEESKGTVRDGLGREWSLMTLVGQGKDLVLEVDVERIFLLMIERNILLKRLGL